MWMLSFKLHKDPHSVNKYLGCLIVIHSFIYPFIIYHLLSCLQVSDGHLIGHHEKLDTGLDKTEECKTHVNLWPDPSNSYVLMLLLF